MSDEENVIAFPAAEESAAEEPSGSCPPEHLVPALEACLFAVTQPVPTATLAAALGVSEEQVTGALEALRERQLRTGAGVRLVEVGEGWQLRTEPRMPTWVAAVRVSSTALCCASGDRVITRSKLPSSRSSKRRGWCLAIARPISSIASTARGSRSPARTPADSI